MTVISRTHNNVSACKKGTPRGPWMKLKKPIWTMIWNETPNSLRNIPKKIFRKKLKVASLDILKTIDNYIDNDKITANLNEYWRLCLLFLISMSFFTLFFKFNFEPHCILKSQYCLWWLSQRLFFWVSPHLGFLNFWSQTPQRLKFLEA